jgi:hypothetical protein
MAPPILAFSEFHRFAVCLVANEKRVNHVSDGIKPPKAPHAHDPMASKPLI